MSKTALVIGGTAKDVVAMGCFIINFLKTNPNVIDDIVIFHDGISIKDQKCINRIHQSRFIEYEYPVTNLSDYHSTTVSYFTTMVFCKYECFKLLEEYQTVIWSDYDVVILDSIADLIDSTQSSLSIMIAPDISLKSMFLPEITEIDMSKYNLTENGFSTALCILHKNIGNYLEMYNYCLEKTELYSKYLYLPEQCIVNLLIQDFKISSTVIDFNIYCVHPKQTELLETAKILHAYGQPKFWNGIKNETWNKNYLIWLLMGGSHLPCKEKIYKILRKIIRFMILFLPYGIVKLTKKKLLSRKKHEY